MRSTSVDVHDDITRIDRKEWDAVVAAAGGSPFHCHGWLRAYELHAPHRSTPQHLVVSDERGLQAVLPLYLTEGCPRLDAHRRILPTRPTTLPEPMLLGHTFYAVYGGPLVRPGAPAATLDRLLDELARLAQRLDVAVYGLVNVPETQVDVLERLAERGYTVVHLASSMVMSVVWDSFEGYVAHLPRKRRPQVRRAARRAAELGLQTEWVRRPAELGDVLELIRSVFERHGHDNSDLYPERYLRGLVDELADNLSFLLVRGPDGDLLATLAVLEFGGVVAPWIAGLDYARLREYEQYHAAVRATIDRAIRIGAAEIDEGRGTYDFKRRYGFRPRALHLALAATSAADAGEVERWAHDLADNAARRRERGRAVARS